MKKTGIVAAVVATILASLYFGLDYYTFRSGVAHTEEEIKEVLDLADDIYDPLIDGQFLWDFPFPDKVHWRLVRRGSMLDLNGTAAPSAVSEFLRSVDRPDLSARTYPTESGLFQVVVEEASVRGNVNLGTGEFRLEINPVIPRD